MKSIYCRLFCLFVVLNLTQTYTISSHLGSQIVKKPRCVGLTSLVFSYFVYCITCKSSAAFLLETYSHSPYKSLKMVFAKFSPRVNLMLNFQFP